MGWTANFNVNLGKLKKKRIIKIKVLGWKIKQTKLYIIDWENKKNSIILERFSYIET